MNKQELIIFIDTNLKNKNSKLEGQRLTENWFRVHKFETELNYFLKNNILDRIRLYNFINNTSPECECGNIKRFKNFNEGYMKYCEQCSRTKYNYMKRQGSKNIELNRIVDYVKNNGKYSTSKIKQLSKETINDIIRRTKYLDNNAKISERIYHIEYNLTEYPKCKICNNKNSNFRTSITGYFPYCKNKCSYKIKENGTNKSKGLRKKFYKHFIEKYNKISSEEYIVEIFSESDYLEQKECVVRFKHIKCRHLYTRDISYQGHLKCPKCFPVRSRTQYEIFEELKSFTKLIFNDRKHINPKEIDILSHEYKFGIEYDSISYHSTGYHDKHELNNTVEDKKCHLNKTVLMEETGYQLFRIFSNEWTHKRTIWSSVIKNKMNQCSKLGARKCTIKELNSSECNEFLELNHLQGKCRASVRLGLFYNDGCTNELVSVMTFGKSRYNKDYQYELIRFCSKLELTVQGGASKLLNYFKKTYKPKSIISYANRRWSTGNLYEKLGFKFIRNSGPNYFYFKGNDYIEKLQSRVQFQKHKLKDKLEVFNSELTETQNMYNNGYRKIFDCGNKVYGLIL